MGWLAVIALSPLYWLIAGLIRLETPGPAFFRQIRIGKDGRPFLAYKFRSMVDNASSIGLKLNVAVNDPRITRMGDFLRNTSLDELPQLFNVLKGEMSLVGPRPMMVDQKKLYGEEIKDYVRVSPGITGLWQVTPSAKFSAEEMIELDINYIENWNIWLDLLIIFKTLYIIIARKGL